jgi:hypothetical protein
VRYRIRNRSKARREAEAKKARKAAKAGRAGRAIYLIPVLAFLAYSGLVVPVRHALRSSTENVNYFKDLAQSFTHGRLDIDPSAGSGGHDLVFFEGKHYLYWPPVPALVYVPFVLVWGTNTPDHLIVAAQGALNSLLLIILLFRFVQRYELGMGRGAVAAIVLFWAFGTVHFYLSMRGSVWFYAQVLGQSFLILSLIFALHPSSTRNLVLSGICFALAAYTRNDLVFCGFLHAAIYATKDGLPDLRGAVRSALLFLLPFLGLSGLNLAYNQARFHDLFENGIKYHRMADHFRSAFAQHGFISIHHYPRNFYYEVLRPMELQMKWRPIVFDAEGFGFLWASPVFLLLVPAGYCFILGLLGRDGRLAKRDLIFMAGAILSVLGVSTVIFVIMGTGWIQFGARYTLDFHLALILFGLFLHKTWGEQRTFRLAFAGLLALSIFINYLGVCEMIYEPR